MKLAKKWLSVLFLGCTALLFTACSDNADKNTSETETVSATVPMFETALATTAVSETSGTETTTSVSETTTEITSTTEETTQTTTTETTTTTSTATTTETTVTTTTVLTADVVIATAEPTAPAPEEIISQKFEPGIWWSISSEGERYFCFYTANHAGSFQDQESGLGMAFSYDTTDDENILIFHIGDAESSERVQASFPDSNTAVLTWENGSTETLSYQGLGNFDTFHFYSNLELCEMALDYYEAKYAYRPADASAEIQADGKISIQLYDNMEDHISTSAWYTVDRFTAQGTDIMGNTINLNS
ncbi:MAG: hypothetical protein IJJ69_11960 [Oscillospiraceae bacterium]|nr:hypothetical protein [Oscillospiraceae bacterium]